MGTWGSAAWENDVAADWFGALFASTQMAERVEATLKNDVAEPEEWRAAASILAALGRVYVWPVGFLDQHLDRDAVETLLRGNLATMSATHGRTNAVGKAAGPSTPSFTETTPTTSVGTFGRRSRQIVSDRDGDQDTTEKRKAHEPSLRGAPPRRIGPTSSPTTAVTLTVSSSAAPPTGTSRAPSVLPLTAEEPPLSKIS